ncbi:unnamed protein product [Didymodactylos carnosus]|uniref:Uncharacterized protein n=2 Tax=Didymodactylos carnosus TaxID=1234261 RepID=A0A8S2UX92_9BILA|nr:unnamed protein product [Didymodactylos carnosus]
MAICEGKLHRREIPQQQDQPTTFSYNNNDFPVMNTDKIKSNPWNIQNNNSDQQNIMNYLQQMNYDIKQNFKQINDKLNIQQQVIEINTANTHLNKIVIQSTLSTLSKMMNKVIKPFSSLIQEEREKESILRALDDYGNDLLKQHTRITEDFSSVDTRKLVIQQQSTPIITTLNNPNDNINNNKDDDDDSQLVDYNK